MQNNETSGPPGSAELLRSAWGVGVISAFVGALALLSLILFAYKIQCADPNDLHSGRHYRDTPGAWLDLSGHLLRATLLTWLFICLLRYSKALRRLRAHADSASVNSATVRGWNALGWSAIVMTLFTSVAVYDFAWGLPRFLQLSAPKDLTSELFKDEDIVLEFREAAHEPREGLNEHSMTVIEPVKKPIYLADEPIVETQDIARATVGLDDGGHPTLQIQLTDDGAKKMRITTETLSRRFQESRTPAYIALMIDGKVETVPMVTSPMGHAIQIQGNFTTEQAEDIAKMLTDSIARRTKK